MEPLLSSIETSLQLLLVFVTVDPLPKPTILAHTVTSTTWAAEKQSIPVNLCNEGNVIQVSDEPVQ